MQYQPYPEYGEVKEKSLGKKPVNWDSRRLKFSIKLKNIKINAKESDLEYMGMENIESFTGRKIFDEENPITSEGVGSLFEKNDVLFGKLRPYLAKAYLCKEQGFCSTELLVFEGEKLSPKFLQYMVLSDWFVSMVDSSTYGAKMPRASWDFIGNLVSLLPHEVEQEAIVNFLDYKTHQIDRLIEKKKALIEKLDEQRIAVITQAVTKGINGKTKMKPSGVEWLGDIPEHWEVKRLRFCLNTNPVKSEVNQVEGDTLVSFVPMDAVSEYGGMNASATKPIEEVYSGYTYFAENDVVIAKITPCFENGKGSLAKGLTNDIGFGTTEFHVLRATGEIISEYIFYLTICHPFRDIGASEMLGAGGQKRVPDEFIKDLRLGIPEINEQKEIVEHINTELARIDDVKRVSYQVIALYEEYRSALITSAVTGKIDVRRIASDKALDK